jgi:hypothetical protein
MDVNCIKEYSALNQPNDSLQQIVVDGEEDNLHVFEAAETRH